MLAEICRMSDSALVMTFLLTGGAIYMAIILWITVVRVRESDANQPPPSH